MQRGCQNIHNGNINDIIKFDVNYTYDGYRFIKIANPMDFIDNGLPQ